MDAPDSLAAPAAQRRWEHLSDAGVSIDHVEGYAHHGPPDWRTGRNHTIRNDEEIYLQQAQKRGEKATRGSQEADPRVNTHTHKI